MTVIKRLLIVAIEIIICAIILLSFLPIVTGVTVKVKAEVEGEGFHRTLKYHLDTGGFKNKSCYIAVIFELPSLLYTDVNQLADLRRLQKTSACSQGEIDVELFSEKAYHQNVTICSRLINSKTILSVPVHQRYRFATKTGKSVYFEIPHPVVLLGCKDRLKEHRVSKIRICSPCIEYVKKWRDVIYTWEGDGGFTWEIPTGDTSKKFVVTSVTMLVTLLGCAYVLWTIHNSFNVPAVKKTKDN